MTENFADQTAVVQIADGEYAAEIAQGWDIAGVPNGGYVLAIAARAMAESVGRPPLSITAHYLSPTQPGPCSVQVEPVRVGRRLAVVTAGLQQNGREAFRVLGTFGESSGVDPLLVDGQPPELPPYEDCIDVPSTAAPWPAIYDRLAVRWRPGDDGFGRGEPTGRAEIAGWFAFTDAAGSEPYGTGGSDKSPSPGRVDAIGLLLVADAFAPPVFNIGLGPGWVPTLELTVHIRAVPAPGPLRCVFRTRYVQGGLLSEDGEMWDEAGVLVAQSRQLALVPRT
ncbi:MAG: thioesterase family protein [Actinomycetota bacterium]|nr:thioesterase family protein [Actinomycetota bacterium]